MFIICKYIIKIFIFSYKLIDYLKKNSPFDIQNCSIVIGSWLYDNSRINFEQSLSKIDLASYQVNPIWTLQTVY